MLGDEYMWRKYRYRTNVDIASMFAVWDFELVGVDRVHWLVSNSVKEDWRGGLEGFIWMVRDGEGFVCPNGMWLHSSEFQSPLCPFLLWSANCSKEVHRASTQIGMHGVQEYIRVWEHAEICLVLEKWNPSIGRKVGGDSSLGSSPKKMHGRPRGSKNTTGGRSLWIGFPLEAHDDHVDDKDQCEHLMDGCEKGKEIVVVNAPH